MLLDKETENRVINANPEFKIGKVIAINTTRTSHAILSTEYTSWNFLKFVRLNILVQGYVDGLVQERRNSIANALELCLSCTNPSVL